MTAQGGVYLSNQLHKEFILSDGKKVNNHVARSLIYEISEDFGLPPLLLPVLFTLSLSVILKKMFSLALHFKVIGYKLSLPSEQLCL